MDNITIIAINILKESSRRLDLIFLLLARDIFTPTEWSLLKASNQYINVIKKIIHNKPTSLTVILRISPTSILEYLEKFPPLDRIIRPIDILREEKTDITVSVDKVFLRLI